MVTLTREQMEGFRIEGTVPFAEAQVGDYVTRLMSSALIPSKHRVDRLDENLIYCYCSGPDDAWTFDRKLGVEVDELLGYGIEREGEMVVATWLL